MKTITTQDARTLIRSEGATRVYFPADGTGNVIHDDAARLPDGSIVVLRCVAPNTACRYEGRIYTPGEAIAHRNLPTPYGIYGGRHSDWLDHSRRCGERALAEGATPADIETVWGRPAPTAADVAAQRERGARNRAAADAARRR